MAFYNINDLTTTTTTTTTTINGSWGGPLYTGFLILVQKFELFDLQIGKL